MEPDAQSASRGNIEQLYTAPTTTTDDTDRQQFEGDLSSYYATNNSQADTLTQYVFALSTALVCGG
jgi:hypothetical protein